MLEFLLCSLVTVLPDYLFRRFAQGKRIGREITLYSVWYELRWGISGCVILTVALITMIFYYHPATKDVTSFFRTVTILPETPGRVAEVMVENNQTVEAGAVLFRLEDEAQQTAVETARAKIAELDAAQIVAESEVAAAQGVLEQVRGSLEQAEDELETRRALLARSSDIVSERDIERFENVVATRSGAVQSALANRAAANARIETLIPAQRASAEAALAQAEADLANTIVSAGARGQITQFALRVGDFVSPLARPAGLIITDDDQRGLVYAGFNQIATQVIKPGMIAEISCVSKPFTVIPMRVIHVQEVIAAGQFRPTDRLLDIQDTARPGTLSVELAPLFPGQTDGIPPGSKCLANAYTSNHDKLADPALSQWEKLGLHAVDAVAVVHALILRVQTIMLPVQTLVFSGH